MILLTGCTPPSTEPAGPIGSAAPPSASSDLTLLPSDRLAARRAATAAMRDYLRTQRSPHAWWAALEPPLSADARRDYAGTDPATIAAARLTGLNWRNSAALGMLMNTRGLMELIVLNIGLDLGIISPTLFAMMVVMALATTAATAPVLKWLVPDHDTPNHAHIA